MKDQFESFISELLSHHDFADALRKITNNSEYDLETSLMSSVEQVLLESNIAAQFNPDGYEDEKQKTKVLHKLQQVKSLLIKNMLSDSSAELQTVNLCIKHVTEGWALTTEMVNYLNKIYKTYD